MDLAEVLARYPLNLTVKDGSVVLRPMQRADREALRTLTRDLPDHDLLFLPDDITELAEVDAWIAQIEGGTRFTVLAFSDDELVGYSTVAGRGPSWMRHVVDMHVVVAVTARRRGLGRFLTHEAFLLAKGLGAKKMVAQMTADQQDAIGMFRRLGFEREASLHHEVMDRDGELHDLLVLRHDVDEFAAMLPQRQAAAELAARGF
jgi:L-amino acid N-acyltransferase YncA